MGKSSTPTEYQKFVNEKSPSSPLFTDCIKAFLVGGLICSIGQLIFFFCKYKGLDETSCSTIVSISLIGIAAFLTSINDIIILFFSLKNFLNTIYN